jgi:hypothetical protein
VKREGCSPARESLPWQVVAREYRTSLLLALEEQQHVV